MAKNIPLFTFVFAAYAAIQKNPGGRLNFSNKSNGPWPSNVSDLFKARKMAHRAQDGPPAAPSVSASGVSSVKVLVVDDDPSVPTSIVNMTHKNDFEILYAVNAKQAMSILRLRQDVQIVFTDMMTPGLIDGMEFARMVRKRWPQIEIVLASGHREVSTFDLPGKCLFIKKPFEPERIVSIFRGLAKSD